MRLEACRSSRGVQKLLMVRDAQQVQKVADGRRKLQRADAVCHNRSAITVSRSHQHSLPPSYCASLGRQTLKNLQTPDHPEHALLAVTRAVAAQCLDTHHGKNFVSDLITLMCRTCRIRGVRNFIEFIVHKMPNRQKHI